MTPTRILAAITPVRVAWATVGLVVGVWSGATAAGVPDVKAPHQCTVAFNSAERIFIAQRNEVTSTSLLHTRGQSEFGQHEAEIARLWDEIDEAKIAYDEAKASCLGGAR